MKIVILPGLDGTGKMLSAFVEKLETSHSTKVMRYPTNEALSYSELTDFVLNQLPTDEPYIIIAESFSGPVAVKLAMQTSNRLKGIIFAASFLKNPTFIPKQFGALSKALPLKSSIALKLARPFTFGKWTSKSLQLLLINALKGVSHSVLAHRLKQVMAADELSAFSRLTLPMLYLRPTADNLVSKSNALEMRAQNKYLAIKDVEGPHFILQANAESCFKHICLFINKVS